ncbi:hypothetical protein RKD20_003034 [Streptomyces sp. SLBN-8D4]
MLALARGEDVSAAWMVAAALGSYAIGHRCYAKFIAYKVLKVDATRATPAERLDNGFDFHPTDRRALLGHHFAAIAGAGPLVGPVLAAQMGCLPGTVWIIASSTAVLAPLIVVVIADALRVCVRHVHRPALSTLSEAPYVESRILATAGLVPTRAEKEEARDEVAATGVQGRALGTSGN